MQYYYMGSGQGLCWRLEAQLLPSDDGDSTREALLGLHMLLVIASDVIIWGSDQGDSQALPDLRQRAEGGRGEQSQHCVSDKIKIWNSHYTANSASS